VNTLTLILDAGGNVFGDFTPLPWESENGDWKCDESWKSFVFSHNSPHNIQPNKFALKAGRVQNTINCNCDLGPVFGGHVRISDRCCASPGSYTVHFGGVFINDTGLRGEAFFTDSGHFRMREFEVFQITDSPICPNKGHSLHISQ
jgi:hypothetical protein